MTTQRTATPTFSDSVTPEQRAADAGRVASAIATASDATLAVLDAVQGITDPLQGALEASEMLDLVNGVRAQVADIRRGHLIRAANEGWSLKEMAEVLSVSRARVDQIINDR